MFTLKKSTAPSDGTGLLLEQLRYAGLLSYNESEDGDREVTIWSPLPRGCSHLAWQSQQVLRMESFGIVARPVTRTM